MSNAIAIIHKAEILARVADGDTLSVIAKDYQVTKQALSRQLTDDPEYQEAIVLGVEAVMEKRVSELECASTSVDVARTRELLAHSRFIASTLARDKYGKDTVIAAQSTPVFNVIIQSSQSQSNKLIISQEQEVGGVKITSEG